LGFGIVIPLLPIYSEDFGASELALGLLFASFSAMQFLFAPLWGRLSDRVGRRPVLLGGLVGTSASYVLFAYSHSMPMLFAARLLAGFFGANVSTAQAYIADVSAPEDRAKSMGVLGAAFGLGFTFGPLVGGELVSLSMAAPGFVAAGLSLTAAIFGFFRLPEPPRHRGQASRVFGTDTLKLVTGDGRLGALLALYFLSIFSFSGFESMFIRFGLAKFPTVFGVSSSVAEASHQEVLAAAPIAGRYMFFIGLLAAFIQGGLLRRLVPRFGEVTLVVIGPLLLGLAFVVIGTAPVWSLVIVGCAIMPFGFGITNPSLTGLLSRTAPVDQQGSVLGINQSLGSLARVLGPLVAGAVFHYYGASAPFFTSATVLAGAVGLAWWYRRVHGPAYARHANDQMR
jgi:MFS family permease